MFDLCYHMVKAEKYAKLTELLVSSKDWRIFKQRDGERGASFIREVAALLDHFKQSAAPEDIRNVILLRAANSGVHLDIDSFQDHEVKLLISLGRVKEVESAVELATGPEQQFKILRMLLKALPTRGWQSCLKAALAIEVDWVRAPALIELAQTLFEIDRKKEANQVLAIAQEHTSLIANVGNRSQELLKVVSKLVDWNRLDEALQIVDQIPTVADQVWGLVIIAKHIFKDADAIAAMPIVERAEKLTRSKEWIDPDPLIDLAELLVMQNASNRALRIYSRARVAALQYHDREDRQLAEQRIAASMNRRSVSEIESRQDEAGPNQDHEDSPLSSDEMLSDHHTRLVALRAANAIVEPFERAKALMRLGTAKGVSGWSEVVPAIRAIERTDSCGHAWRLFAKELKSIGLVAESAEAYREAVLLSKGKGSEPSLGETAAMMARDGFHAESIATAESIQDSLHRGHALRKVAIELADQGFKDEANSVYDRSVAAFEAHKHQWQTEKDAPALRTLGEWLANQGAHVAAKQIFNLAAKCAEEIPGDPSGRAVELSKLFDSPGLARHGDLMCDIADRVSDDYHGIKLRLSVKAASALANSGNRVVAEAMLRTAESKIQDLEERLLPEAMTAFCDALLKGRFDDWATEYIAKTCVFLQGMHRETSSLTTYTGWLIKAVGSAGRVDDAQRIAQLLGAEDYALAELVQCLGKLARFSEADLYARKIGGYWSAEAFKGVAIAAARMGRAEIARAWIDKITDREALVRALVSVIPHILGTGAVSEGIESVERAYALLKDLRGDDLQVRLLGQLAMVTADHDLRAHSDKYCTEAFRYFGGMKDVDSRRRSERSEIMGDMLMARATYIESLNYFDGDPASLAFSCMRNTSRLDKLQSGFTGSVLRSLATIIGWERPYWAKASTVLCSSTGS
jgi:tetratricopeptide (TPR) repeat protein